MRAPIRVLAASVLLALLAIPPGRAEPRIAGADKVGSDVPPRDLEAVLARETLDAGEISLIVEAAPRLFDWIRAHRSEWAAADLGLRPRVAPEVERAALARLRELGVWEAAGVRFEEYLAFRVKLRLGWELLREGPASRLREAREQIEQSIRETEQAESTKGESPEALAERRASAEKSKRLLALAAHYPEVSERTVSDLIEVLRPLRRLFDRFPSTDPEESARRFSARFGLVAWPVGKVVHAAVANFDDEAHTLLLGIKPWHARGDDSWKASFRPVEIGARTVVLYRIAVEKPGNLMFLAFRGQVDENYDVHDDFTVYEHLVAESGPGANHAILSGCAVRRGGVATVSWKPKHTYAVNLVRFDRRAYPWLSVEASPGVTDVGPLTDAQQDDLYRRCVSLAGESERMRDLLRPQQDGLVIAFEEDATLRLRMDTDRMPISGHYVLLAEDADKFNPRWSGGGGVSVGTLLIYDADMKVVEMAGPGVGK